MKSSAAILVIGNEILSGKTADTNSPFLARELRDLGVELRRILVVPDENDEIVNGVRGLMPDHDFVFTSGGVGPTHDDVTLAAIAEALGRPLVRNEEMAAIIRQFHDVERTPHALRMADVPAGSELIFGDELRVPVVRVENLYILPGVPFIFEKKVRAIRERFRTEPYFLRQFHVATDEVDIAQVLYDIVDRHPGLMVGSYPEMSEARDRRVKVTIESKDQALVERALDDLLKNFPLAEIIESKTATD